MKGASKHRLNRCWANFPGSGEKSHFPTVPFRSVTDTTPGRRSWELLHRWIKYHLYLRISKSFKKKKSRKYSSKLSAIFSTILSTEFQFLFIIIEWSNFESFFIQVHFFFPKPCTSQKILNRAYNPRSIDIRKRYPWPIVCRTLNTKRWNEAYLVGEANIRAGIT